MLSPRLWPLQLLLLATQSVRLAAVHRKEAAGGVFSFLRRQLFKSKMRQVLFEIARAAAVVNAIADFDASIAITIYANFWVLATVF